MIFRISFIVFAAIALVASTTALAAGGKAEVRSPGKAFVEISSAVAGARGALISWDVTNGGNVIGYNVYRETEKGLVQVNPATVPGSYLSSAIADDFAFSFYDGTGAFGVAYRIGIIEIGAKERFTDSAFAIYDAGLRAPETAFGSHTSLSNNPGLKIGNAPSKHYMSFGLESITQDLATQQWVAGQPGVKINVSKDGLYRVSRTELENAGFNVSAPPENWQLYFHGIEQSIIVPSGGEYIEFFGESLDTPESSQNVYFLIAGAVAGKRVGSRYVRTLRAPVSARSFSSTLQRKRYTVYASTIRNGSASNFFGEIISPTPTTINFDLESLDELSADAVMTLELQGLTIGAHQTRVVINGLELTPLSVPNRQLGSRTYTVPVSSLLEAGNSLELTSTAGSSDFTLVASITITYDRKFNALNDQLPLVTQNYKQTEILGFSDASVRVFDLTHPENTRAVVNARIEPEDKGAGSFKAVIPANRRLNLFAVSDGGLLQPDSLAANVPSTLSSTNNAANYLIITHPAFTQEALDWADYRTNDGYQTKVIDINDIFDEFSFGQNTAGAINSFLAFAEFNWQVDPDYVLLIGDGSYDPQNFEGQGAFNLMPAQLVDTLYEETASDDAIADFDGDGLAEIAIGRIPARIPVHVTNALAKLTSFETSIGAAPARGALCASDLPNGYDFAALCDRVQSELPASIPISSINRGDANSHAQLIAAINTGKYVVNYSGHGASGLWAVASFFSVSDVPSLNNADLSLFTMLTCLNGYFIRPVTDSLSEALLKRTGGGAVAVWSSSGSTTPDIQEVMARRFFNQLGAPGEQRLGDLINDAKGTINGGADVRRSWVLLGDPALRVKPGSGAENAKAGS